MKRWFTVRRPEGFWTLYVPAIRLAVVISGWRWGTNHSWAGRQWYAGPLIITKHASHSQLQAVVREIEADFGAWALPATEQEIRRRAVQAVVDDSQN